MKRRILAILIAWVLIVSVGTAETFDSFDSVDGFFMWDEPFFAQEMVASASIPLHGTDELINNVMRAADSINDTVLPMYGIFSFNNIVGPRTEECGFQPALNGRGVTVVGGGVAQVASVIWLAIRNLDEAVVLEKATYGKRYNQSYVDSSNDAILTDYNSGQDFAFRNDGEATLTICTYVWNDELICEIYAE